MRAGRWWPKLLHKRNRLEKQTNKQIQIQIPSAQLLQECTQIQEGSALSPPQLFPRSSLTVPLCSAQPLQKPREPDLRNPEKTGVDLQLISTLPALKTVDIWSVEETTPALNGAHRGLGTSWAPRGALPLISTQADYTDTGASS